MTTRHWKTYLRIAIIVLLVGAINGQTATVDGPAGGAIEEGQDAVFTCEVTHGDTSIYIWNDQSADSTEQVFVNGGKFSTAAKYENFESSSQGDVMTIRASTIDDEGLYNCAIAGYTSPTFEFKVEVGSTLNPMFPTNPLIAGTEYTAVCDVVGSRPQLDIAWTLNDNYLDVTPVVINPANTNTNLSDTNSAITFTATPEMNGQNLKCTTDGHVVTSLNREETTQLNVEYAPTGNTATIEVVPIKEGDHLRVTCQVSAVGEGVEPSNPAVTDFTIYTGSEQMCFCSSGVNSLLVDVPEKATDYKCSASNDVGTIESEVLSYDPGRATAQSTTTEPTTSEPPTTDAPAGTPVDTVPCSGLSDGAIAGMVVLVVLLSISVCTNVVLFVLWRRDRNPQGQPADKIEDQVY